MPSLMKNYNPLIHIMGEVVVIAGVTFFFYLRITKLNVVVTELTKKINEQQLIIQRHEDILNKILKNSGPDPHIHQPIPVHFQKNFTPQQPPQPPPKSEELETGSVLDDELLSELGELSEPDSTKPEDESTKLEDEPESSCIVEIKDAESPNLKEKRDKKKKSKSKSK